MTKSKKKESKKTVLLTFFEQDDFIHIEGPPGYSRGDLYLMRELLNAVINEDISDIKDYSDS